MGQRCCRPIEPHSTHKTQRILRGLADHFHLGLTREATHDSEIHTSTFWRLWKRYKKRRDLDIDFALEVDALLDSFLAQTSWTAAKNHYCHELSSVLRDVV